MDDDAEIIAEFLVESHENLDQLDRDLVELERAPGSRELLSSIFRTIHTIKGTSGFLAFNRLEALTHVGENLLSRLRDGEMVMTGPVTEELLRMVDTVRALLDSVESSGKDTAAEVDVETVVAALKAVLDGTPGGGEAPAGVPEEEASAATIDPGASSPDAPAAAVPFPSTVPVAEPVLAEPVLAEPVPAEPVLAEPVLAETLPAEPVPTEPDAREDDESARRGVVDSSVRVDVDLLDSLVQLVGELVLTRNQVLQRTEGAADIELLRAAQRLDLVASELQEGIMKTRMQPIGQVWSKMPRIVRDLAVQLGREVDLQMEGHETELDRSLLEALKGPLTHLVRNALDHGIEPPAQRVAAGKPAQGRLLLRSFHESGQVVVEISDDGKGIDPEVITRVAIERNVVTRDQASRMEPREIVNLIFRPGFSTAAEVTNVSGRGVGMDVVRTNIERIGGTVDMQSQVGVGTTCRVRIPLTLAIIPALVIGEGEETYAIPQANLVELVRLEADDLARNVEEIAGAPLLRLRGHLLPLVSMAEVLGRPRPDVDALTVVVVQADEVRFGICVDAVHDTQEIVVKPIGRQLKALATYAGATIMGDGRVALILDVPGIAHAHALAQHGRGSAQTADPVATADASTALLVLEVGGQRAALPLREVSRLEEFALDRIETSGGVEAVQYRDGILPLVRLAGAIGLAERAREDDQVSVVVHEAGASRIGIVIDRVLDVVDVAVAPSEVGRRTGVLGSAVIGDRVTDLVDLEAVVRHSGVGA
ncbi:chemotaxis protein CheA [Nocardioides marmoriginsengisoli]|uniref:histidine kinase n=1 Tax=Nocardioides marmoriginsengisoli TaxID=661483 RepID=A0A3N0CC76_9ACTN|nr:chemotaxis protein CheA [Nocardioides marmoriginsengisoli]RNL61048.1 chemotaxis protein CheA [Nocardioides marmoriginsengisoli]